MTDRPAHQFLGLNQSTYERLKTALSLDLRRQIFIAVCDDLPLRDRLAIQLQTELAYFSSPSAQTAAPRALPRLVSLELDLDDPNPLAQVVTWLDDVPVSKRGRHPVFPAFQILGIERLTRQSATTQTVFLSYLQAAELQLGQIESCLVFWMTQPWFRMLSEAAPEFWGYRTGVFEFIGDPTPLPIASPERIQMDSGRELFVSPPAETDRQISPLDQRNPAPPLSLPDNPWLPLADEFNHWYETEEVVLPDSAAFEATDQSPELSLQPWTDDLNLPTERSSADGSVAEDDPSVKTAKTLLSVAIATQQLINREPQIQAEEPVAPGLATLPSDLDLDFERALSNQNLESGLTDQSVLDLSIPDQSVPDQSISLLQHISLLQYQLEQLQQGQESPEGLATAYRTLGNFYRDCIEQGDVSIQTLMVAIQAYEQALQWLPEWGADRAETLNDVGNLYWMVAQVQPEADQARAYLQQTVQHYEQALQILQIDPLEPRDPQQGLMVVIQNNLGATYADLARYDQPEANLSRSVAAYEQVLCHRTAETDPLRYASTQNNLGTTLWNLAQHRQPQLNLRRAVHAYAEALRYHDVEQEPLNYAMIHNNLGTAYWNLAQYEQPVENLQQALAAYQIALQHRPVEMVPASFVATQNNIGTAYWHLASHTNDPTERLAYLQQAIAAYEITLNTACRLDQPTLLNFDLASTRNHLALAHHQMATLQPQLSPDAQAAHLQSALHCHLLALQDWDNQPDFRPVAVNGIVQTLRTFYLQLGLPGQNHALAQLPGQLLPEILPKL